MWGGCEMFSGMRSVVSSVLSSVSDAVSDAYNAMTDAIEQHQRADEFRRLQADNDIAASLAELRAVKAAAMARVLELKNERSNHRRAACAADTTDDARISVKLLLMYTNQCKHASETLLAIEAHIMSLETYAVHRRVMRALRTAGSHDDIDEEADAACDHAAERFGSSQRVLEMLRDVPSAIVDDCDVDRTMHELLSGRDEVPGRAEVLLPQAPRHVPDVRKKNDTRQATTGHVDESIQCAFAI